MGKKGKAKPTDDNCAVCKAKVWFALCNAPGYCSYRTLALTAMECTGGPIDCVYRCPRLLCSEVEKPRPKVKAMTAMGEKSCLCWQCPHVKECDVEYHRLKLRRKPRMEVEKP